MFIEKGNSSNGCKGANKTTCDPVHGLDLISSLDDFVSCSGIHQFFYYLGLDNVLYNILPKCYIAENSVNIQRKMQQNNQNLLFIDENENEGRILYAKVLGGHAREIKPHFLPEPSPEFEINMSIILLSTGILILIFLYSKSYFKRRTKSSASRLKRYLMV